ncbi:hypothetical protein L5T64_003710 [Salmonella enterica]|nr:hypothetical protein [Salmonella enterica]
MMISEQIQHERPEPGINTPPESIWRAPLIPNFFQHVCLASAYWKWQKLVFRYTNSEKYPWPKDVLYHICLELRHRSTEGQLSRKELEREAVEVLDMWERRVLSGKPIPPVRRALAAPSRDRGPTPAEMLMAKYKQRKDAGLI